MPHFIFCLRQYLKHFLGLDTFLGTQDRLKHLVLRFFYFLNYVLFRDLFQLDLCQFQLFVVLDVLDQEDLIGEEQHLFLMAVLAHVRNIQIRVEHLRVLLFLRHSNRVLDPDLVLRRTLTKLGLALVRTRRQSREEDEPSDRIGFELHS